MKITATKIKQELVDKYGWSESRMKDLGLNNLAMTSLITNTLAIINNILIKEKGVKIK